MTLSNVNKQKTSGEFRQAAGRKCFPMLPFGVTMNLLIFNLERVFFRSAFLFHVIIKFATLRVAINKSTNRNIFTSLNAAGDAILDVLESFHSFSPEKADQVYQCSDEVAKAIRKEKFAFYGNFI
jgi:hypothetical protein